MRHKDTQYVNTHIHTHTVRAHIFPSINSDRLSSFKILSSNIYTRIFLQTKEDVCVYTRIIVYIYIRAHINAKHSLGKKKKKTHGFAGQFPKLVTRVGGGETRTSWISGVLSEVSRGSAVILWGEVPRESIAIDIPSVTWTRSACDRRSWSWPSWHANPSRISI